MVNLIPEKEKIKLILDYQKRRLAVAVGLVLVLCLIGIILLVTIFITLVIEEKNIDRLIQDHRRTVNQDQSDNLRLIAKLTNRRSSLIVSADKSIAKTTEVLEKIELLTPADIKLTSISLEVPAKTDGFKVSLNGLAKNRTGLVNYIENLKADSAISEVNTPVANLIKDINNNFSLTLIFKAGEAD